MGQNSFGQLGDGTTTNRHVPVEIVLSNVTAIAAGFYHSLFLKSDGSLWGMGYNSSGQLGDGTIDDSHVPVEIISGNVTAIAAGGFHSLFLKSDGSLWAMGQNLFGDLGLGDTNVLAINIPSQAVPLATINGGFETGDFLGWSTNGAFSSTDDRVSTKSAYIHSGRYGTQLGQIGSLGFLSQMRPTTPGAKYLLSLWLNSPDEATPNEFLVSWNGITLLDKTNLTAIGWTNIQFVVTATGTSTVLQFGFRDDNAYLGLDDITITPIVQTAIIGIGLAGTNLVLNGSNGVTGETYRTLMSTNLTRPLNEWLPVATNVMGAGGSFTITNAAKPNAPQQFYILQLQ